MLSDVKTTFKWNHALSLVPFLLYFTFSNQKLRLDEEEGKQIPDLSIATTLSMINNNTLQNLGIDNKFILTTGFLLALYYYWVQKVYAHVVITQQIETLLN